MRLYANKAAFFCLFNRKVVTLRSIKLYNRKIVK